MKFWKGSVDSGEQLGDNWVPDFWVHTFSPGPLSTMGIMNFSDPDLSVLNFSDPDLWVMNFSIPDFSVLNFWVPDSSVQRAKWTFESQTFQFWTFESWTFESQTFESWTFEYWTFEVNTKITRKKLSNSFFSFHLAPSFNKRNSFFLSIIHGFCNFAIECSNLEKNSRGSEMSQGSQWENLANLF
jgi:hypothetical protein